MAATAVPVSNQQIVPYQTRKRGRSPGPEEENQHFPDSSSSLDSEVRLLVEQEIIDRVLAAVKSSPTERLPNRQHPHEVRDSVLVPGFLEVRAIAPELIRYNVTLSAVSFFEPRTVGTS